jgi:hypothetical protein
MSKTKTHWVFPRITIGEIDKLKQKYPRASLLVHDGLKCIMFNNKFYVRGTLIRATKNESIARVYRRITKKTKSIYKVIEKPQQGNYVGIQEIQKFEKKGEK